MRAIVIGAGPSGLAAAACLKKAGFTPEILDAGKKIGDSWRRHYDRLHLHTARGRSGLPGLPMPRGPRYPSRDEVVEYLQTYAEHFDLRPKGIIQMLDLLRPIYEKTAAYGHFGRDEPEFTWEKTDKAAALRAAAGL